MSTLKEDDIKQAVQARYSAKAQDASACCSDEEARVSSAIYPASEVRELPDTVIAASAGCGNPVALAELKPGEEVLDLGSGGGIDCFLAAQKVGPLGTVLGVDMTPDMIRLARENAAKIGTSNVVFLRGEIERLPLGDELVDVVMSNCVICLSTDKARVFREVFRVLKPGGRFYISDMVIKGELPQAVLSDPDMWACCIGGAEPKETYLGRIRSAGFSHVEVVGESAYWKSVEPGEEWKRDLVSISVRGVKPAACC